MNIFAFLPFLVLIAPIVPAFIEIFRRKDKGPREFPEQTLPIFERARARARVKIAGEIIRIVGDVSIPSGVEIKENIVVHGNLRLGSKCHVHGSIKTFGEVEVGDDSVIEGHIISERKVTIGRNATVKGIVDSAGDITLGENAVVGAVSTEKSVRLGSGAKINRRIPAGVPITTPPPPLTAEEEEIRTERPVKVTVPSFSTFFEGRRYREPPNEKGRLFQSLRDRIRSLDELKAQVIEEATLKKLSRREAEIYKLAASGYDIDEIGLRLLIDPVQAREVINSLVERGYLDEHLRPVRREAKEETREEAAAVIQRRRTGQEKPEVEELPVEEVFEKLLASKLRIEVKEGLKGEEKEESTAKTEMKEILREWRKASSLLFGPEREEESQKTTNSLNQADKSNRKVPDSAGGSREIESENASKPQRGRYWKGLLPLSTLLSALLTEVAYYNPTIFLFLNRLVPPTLRIWMLFLGVTVTLAITTGVYSAKSISSHNPRGE